MNLYEYQNGLNPTSNDTDNDGMPDGWEVINNLDPLKNDANLDPDRDNLPNTDEYRIGSDPRNHDSDGDYWTDGDEVTRGSDPLDINSFPSDPGDDGILFNLFGIGIDIKDILGITASLLSFLLAYLLLTRRRRKYQHYVLKIAEINDLDKLVEYYRVEILTAIKNEQITPHHAVIIKEDYTKRREELQDMDNSGDGSREEIAHSSISKEDDEQDSESDEAGFSAPVLDEDQHPEQNDHDVDEILTDSEKSADDFETSPDDDEDDVDFEIDTSFDEDDNVITPADLFEDNFDM